MLNLAEVLYLVLYLAQGLAHVKKNTKYSTSLETQFCFAC